MIGPGKVVLIVGIASGGILAITKLIADK